MKDPKQRSETDFLSLDEIVSSTELTGLVPTPPADESESESFADLHQIPAPQPTDDKNMAVAKE